MVENLAILDIERSNSRSKCDCKSPVSPLLPSYRTMVFQREVAAHGGKPGRLGHGEVKFEVKARLQVSRTPSTTNQNFGSLAEGLERLR
jgi:hypothetical protein